MGRPLCDANQNFAAVGPVGAFCLCAALGDIARARGTTDIARAAGITRETLYKALRLGSAPRLDTVNRVCAALGVRLVVQPLRAVAAAWRAPKAPAAPIALIQAGDIETNGLQSRVLRASAVWPSNFYCPPAACAEIASTKQFHLRRQR